MESCYVPNNPNFASVDQWTPPSPTSPPVTSSADGKQHHQQPQQQQQQQQQQQHQAHFTHHHHHDPVIQQLCDSADLVHTGSSISSSGGNDPSSLTSLSALPPVQELLGPCRSPTNDGSVGNKDRGGDPFSSYSLTALDFEPLPGFLTLSSCASYKQHQEMGDLPLGFKSGTPSHSVGNYGSLYPNHHSPQQHHQQQQGPMSPFSAAVAAATQQQQQQNSSMNGNPSNGQCQYSFHGPSASSVAAAQTSKMPHHHHHHHHQPATSSSSYQDNNYSGGCGGAGIFPSMSVNVSMNMTMGMGMSMGPTMSYGIEAGTPLPCWNTHNVTSGIHHLPGVAAAAAAAAAASVNPTNSGYAIAPPAQALLSPIQVSYNSNIYPTSFTPSSASGYCLPGDWRPSSDATGLYELKELKESSPSPFSSGGSSKNYVKPKSSSSSIQQQQNNYSAYPAAEAYPSVGSSSPVPAKKRSQARQISGTTSAPSLTPNVDYDGELASCGSGVSSSSGSSVGGGGTGQGKANLCRVCGKTYARPSTLKTHMRTHSGERPYRCGDCHKSFSQAANLTAHVRTHSGEKPFRCQICDRRFSQSSSVTTHMRTHSGERPYRCRMCKKAFSDSSTLTKHMRIHSGEKPYQCKLCLLRFSQSGNLNRHMRVHSATS